MGPVQTLSALALRRLCGRVREPVGAPALAPDPGAVNGSFADDEPIAAALLLANRQAWLALEVALAGELLWQRVEVSWGANAEDAFCRQVRAFLTAVPLSELDEPDPGFRGHCLREVHAARQNELLTDANLDPFAAPHELPQDQWQELGRLGRQLEQAGFPNLSSLLALRSPEGDPFLVVAVECFFRRAVEDEPALSQELGFSPGEGRAGPWVEGFDALAEALAEHGPWV